MACLEASDHKEVEQIVDIKFFDYGMGVHHNMPCCVYPDNKHAVYDCNLGVFQPSRVAEAEGWRLVQLQPHPNLFVLFLFRLIEKHLFKKGFRNQYGMRNISVWED